MSAELQAKTAELAELQAQFDEFQGLSFLILSDIVKSPRVTLVHFGWFDFQSPALRSRRNSPQNCGRAICVAKSCKQK
jgi:hypothetical protein